MAMAKRCIVPVDFSKPSEVARDQARKLAHESSAPLTLLHALSGSLGHLVQRVEFSDVIR